MKVSKRMRGGVASKLTNVALALVLVLGMSPATKAVAASNAAGEQSSDETQTVVNESDVMLAVVYSSDTFNE